MAERATQGDEPNKGTAVRLIQQCIDDFAESVSLPETWSQKLDYADSDVLRSSNLVRRMRQLPGSRLDSHSFLALEVVGHAVATTIHQPPACHEKNKGLARANPVALVGGTPEWSPALKSRAAWPPENEGQQLLRFLQLRAGLGFEDKPIGIRDIQYGILSWCRQLEFYSGLVVAADTCADKAGAEATSTGPAQGQDASHLCMKWVLQSTPSTTEEQSTKDVRKKVKGRLQALCDRGAKGGRKKKVNGPANTLPRIPYPYASRPVLEDANVRELCTKVRQTQFAKFIELPERGASSCSFIRQDTA